MKLSKLLVLAFALVVALGMGMVVSCTQQPPQSGGGGTGGTGGAAAPKITIVVKLLPNATNLFDPVAGANNDIYIVGSLAGLKLYSDTNKVLQNWNPGDTNAKMTFLSNDSDGLPLYKIEFLNDLTNGVNLQFKFVNGTPGFGGVWANVEKTADDGEINNRTATIDPGVDVLITNIDATIVTGANVDVAPNGIQKWANVGPTYSVTNVTLTIIVSNVATNNASGNLFGAFGLSGDFNGWGDPDLSSILGTNGDGTVNISNTITNYFGGASIGFKTRGSNTTSGSWDWEGGGNHSISLPPSFASGGSTNIYTIHNGW